MSAVGLICTTPVCLSAVVVLAPSSSTVKVGCRLSATLPIPSMESLAFRSIVSIGWLTNAVASSAEIVTARLFTVSVTVLTTVL